MAGNRDTHRVSCKCALFSPDGGQVLVIDYGKEGYGLPGGHIDANESPDQAMARELFEELGLKDIELEHGDFMLHRNGKIVLGYTGTLATSTQLKPQVEEMQDAIWVEVDGIENGSVSVPSYGKFICQYRPSNVVV